MEQAQIPVNVHWRQIPFPQSSLLLIYNQAELFLATDSIMPVGTILSLAPTADETIRFNARVVSLVEACGSNQGQASGMRLTITGDKGAVLEALLPIAMTCTMPDNPAADLAASVSLGDPTPAPTGDADEADAAAALDAGEADAAAGDGEAGAALVAGDADEADAAAVACDVDEADAAAVAGGLGEDRMAGTPAAALQSTGEMTLDSYAELCVSAAAGSRPKEAAPADGASTLGETLETSLEAEPPPSTDEVLLRQRRITGSFYTPEVSGEIDSSLFRRTRSWEERLHATDKVIVSVEVSPELIADETAGPAGGAAAGPPSRLSAGKTTANGMADFSAANLADETVEVAEGEGGDDADPDQPADTDHESKRRKGRGRRKKKKSK